MRNLYIICFLYFNVYLRLESGAQLWIRNTEYFFKTQGRSVSVKNNKKILSQFLSQLTELSYVPQHILEFLLIKWICVFSFIHVPAPSITSFESRILFFTLSILYLSLPSSLFYHSILYSLSSLLCNVKERIRTPILGTPVLHRLKLSMCLKRMQASRI